MNLPDGFDPSGYAIQLAQVTRRLKHLEMLELGGRTLQVHHTPGHSPGSIRLWDSRDGLLFTGDTADQAEYEVQGGTRLYRFEGFGVRVPEGWCPWWRGGEHGVR